MFKIITLIGGLVFSIHGQTRMASEAFVTNRVAVVSAKISVVESGTNNWNTAFAWGSHAGLYKSIGYVPGWAEITDKPATFAPSAHVHGIADVTGLADLIATNRVEKLWGSSTNFTDAAGVNWVLASGVSVVFNDVYNYNLQSPSFPNPYFLPYVYGSRSYVSDDGFWTVTINTVWPNLCSLTYSLEGMTDTWIDYGNNGNFPVENMTSSTGYGFVSISNGQQWVEASRFATIADLAAGLAAKASTNHTHAISDVPGLQTTLNGKLSASAIPGPGCTMLGTSTLITGATTVYEASPTAAYTLSVTNTAPRYVYSLRVEATNAYSLAAGITQDAAITPSGTNVFVFVPSGTGTAWRVYGRAL